MSCSLLRRFARPGLWVRFLPLFAMVLPLLWPTDAAGRVFEPGEFNDLLSDPLTGVTLEERPDLIGDVIADLTVPLTDQLPDGTVFNRGSFRTQVVREDVAGTLDFYYTLIDADPNEGYLLRGFEGFSTDIDFRVDLGPGARAVGRSEDGDVLDFVNVGRGPTFVKTDATDFAVAGSVSAVFSDGGSVTVDVPTPVPLPAAILAAPLAFAVACVAGRRLRRRG